MEILKLLFRRREVAAAPHESEYFTEHYDLALQINAQLSAQLEALKRQINEQAHLIQFQQDQLIGWLDKTEWVAQLTAEHGDALGIEPGIHRADAARQAISTVWSAHDVVKLEADHCRAVCDELRAKVDATIADRDRLKSLLGKWLSDPDTYPADETLIAQTEAALDSVARAKAGQ